MKTITKSLSNNVNELQTMIANLQQLLNEKEGVISQKSTLIQNLYNQIHLLRHARFGKKSEKVPSTQLGLFDEAELTLEPTTAIDDEYVEVIVKKKRKQAGRTKLPQELPYIEKVYDLEDDEKHCACGSSLVEIGEERTEQLDILPKLTFKVVHVRKKHACKHCEENIKTAPLPKHPIPKSIATPGLLASVIEAKFHYHMPLYRQEDAFKRANVAITRATLGNWMIKCGHLLQPLVKLMHDIINNYDIAFADETNVQVLNEKGRSPTSMSYMWLFIGGPPDKRCYLYQYHPTRSALVPYQFFEDFTGHLHSDCYKAYLNLQITKRIKVIACFAHARRYFHDILKVTKQKKGLAFEALEQIARLYTIEKELREANASYDMVYQVRQNQSKPVLEAFKIWLDEHIQKVPPKSPIAKAMAYSLTHWGELTRFIDDGRFEIDNNRSERSIKPFVIGRKNWLFQGNEQGAHAASTLYSLLETCKQHNIDVYAYFRHVLTKIVDCDTVEELEKLLPFNCSKDVLDQQRAMPELIWPVKSADH